MSYPECTPVFPSVPALHPTQKVRKARHRPTTRLYPVSFPERAPLSQFLTYRRREVRKASPARPHACARLAASRSTLEPDQTRPDQTRPDQTGPDQTRPDRTRPDPTRQDQTRPHQTTPDQTRTDPTRQDQTRPHQTRPDQTRPDQTIPHQPPRWPCG